MAEIIESGSLTAPPQGKIKSKPDAPSAAPVNRTSVADAPSAAPVNRTSVAKAARPAPTVRTSNAGDLLAPPFPLNHARILYSTVLGGSSVSASNGTGAANVLNAATYSRWSFTGAAELVITLPANQMIDAVGLAAHNFAGASVSADYSTSDVAAWQTFAPSQSGGAAMLFLSAAAVSVKRLRLYVTGSGALVLGVVYAGIALQMQRPIYRGVEPPLMARETEYQSTVSEGGQWLGRNVIRGGYAVNLEYRNLSAAWVRAYFEPFAAAAISSPFFVAWNPQEYPRETVYAWTTNDTRPSNTGPRDLMSVKITAKGAA